MSRRMMASSALGSPSASWQAMTASSTSSAPVASPIARYRLMTLAGLRDPLIERKGRAADDRGPGIAVGDPRIERADQELRRQLPDRIGRHQGRLEVLRAQAEADPRHACRPAPPTVTRTGAAPPPAATCGTSPVERQPHRLLGGLAGLDHVGPGLGERPDIGLVGGIVPVAVVLHLEGVALHGAGHLDARQHLVGERADVLERADRDRSAPGRSRARCAPSTCSTSTGSPATPSIGCSMTKPVRLVRKSVTAVRLASNARLPSDAPVIVAR